MTRIILVALIPFLVLAFLVLYLAPGESAQRFSWEIKPAVQAVLMGSGYLAGAYLFLQAVVRPTWHHVAAGLPPVMVFASSMLLITILHWERFDIHHFPFQLWLILYIAAPILVPILWLRNRSQDAGRRTLGGKRVPLGMRITVALVASSLAVFALVGFIAPQVPIGIWPWSLSELSARVLCGWLLLLASGGLILGGEPRWSAWKVPLESMILWFALFLPAAYLHRAGMQDGEFLNWFTAMLLLGLIGMLWVYLYMTIIVRQPVQSTI